jgi:predicted dehydrogenase
MLKVGIIGCGKIADSHVAQLQRIKGCEIVGVCDREELMGQQLAERFSITRSFTDINQMLETARPDVVHITTPPQSHFQIARECLLRGCHTYIEKPITLYAAEAEELVSIAKAQSRKLTAGHDAQFSHAARRMRQVIGTGYLGGPPTHMESLWCYEMGDNAYARALLTDKQHWVRKLPGGLLHNIVSHGIARISEFMTTDEPEVIAHAFPSPLLRKLGEEELVDELRVIISEEKRLTAYFTFSSQMRPGLHEFRIFGPKNGLVLDHDHETLLKLRGERHKSYLEQFVPPVVFARQYLGNLARNLKSFWRRDFHPKAGMKYLIESFYSSIVEDKPLPIPYEEILRTSRIMDAIFKQIQHRRSGPNGQAAALLPQQRTPVSMA